MQVISKYVFCLNVLIMQVISNIIKRLLALRGSIELVENLYRVHERFTVFSHIYIIYKHFKEEKTLLFSNKNSFHQEKCNLGPLQWDGKTLPNPNSGKRQALLPTKPPVLCGIVDVILGNVDDQTTGQKLSNNIQLTGISFLWKRRCRITFNVDSSVSV